jgi:hypothetical protein
MIRDHRVIAVEEHFATSAYLEPRTLWKCGQATIRR